MGPFPESGLVLENFIESGDENSSFSAQQFRNDFAKELSSFVVKGLFLRNIEKLLLQHKKEQLLKWSLR